MPRLNKKTAALEAALDIIAAEDVSGLTYDSLAQATGMAMTTAPAPAPNSHAARYEALLGVTPGRIAGDVHFDELVLFGSRLRGLPLSWWQRLQVLLFGLLHLQTLR